MLLLRIPPPPAFGWRKDPPTPPQAFAWQIPQASTAFYPRRLGEDFPDSGAHSDWDIIFFFPFFVFFRLFGWLVFFLFGGGFGGLFPMCGTGGLLAFSLCFLLWSWGAEVSNGVGLLMYHMLTLCFLAQKGTRITELLNSFDTTRVLMFISFTQLDWK